MRFWVVLFVFGTCKIVSIAPFLGPYLAAYLFNGLRSLLEPYDVCSNKISAQWIRENL